MLKNAIMTYIGLSGEIAELVAFLISMFMLGISLILISTILFIVVDHYCYDNTKVSNDSNDASRISGVPPADQYIVPNSGHPDCGGKFCELRGCAILGSCQAPNRN